MKQVTNEKPKGAVQRSGASSVGEGVEPARSYLQSLLSTSKARWVDVRVTQNRKDKQLLEGTGVDSTDKAGRF